MQTPSADDGVTGAHALVFHVNYFEQGQSTERICQLARELGADGIEFRRKPAAFPGTDLEYLDEVSRALDRHPQEFVSFGGPGVDLTDEDVTVREKELKSAEEFYRQAATRFPLQVVNAFTGMIVNPDKELPYGRNWEMHGSSAATEAQWNQAVSGYRHLGALAEELGFRFAFETHGVYLHDTLAATMRLVREIGSSHVGLLWDHSNLMLFDECPSFQEVLQECGDHLFSVHLKNFLVPLEHFLAVSSLSGGIINIREQIRLLLDSGYTGPLCLESPRPGDRERFAREDLDYLKEILAAR